MTSAKRRGESLELAAAVVLALVVRILVDQFTDIAWIAQVVITVVACAVFHQAITRTRARRAASESAG